MTKRVKIHLSKLWRRENVSKMTAQELSTLMIDKITFITTDPKGRETIWRTTPDVDHSSLCDGWDVEDFERDDE